MKRRAVPESTRDPVRELKALVDQSVEAFTLESFDPEDVKKVVDHAKGQKRAKRRAN
jgi:hypothetical protein